MKIRVRASIQDRNYREGERPARGSPYKVVAIDEFGTVLLAMRRSKTSAQKIARLIRAALKERDELE
jgi:hypothetical protein